MTPVKEKRIRGDQTYRRKAKFYYDPEGLTLRRKASKYPSVFRMCHHIWWIIYEDILKPAEPLGSAYLLPEYAREELAEKRVPLVKAHRDALKSLRAEIRKETGGHCVYCDRQAPAVRLTLEHLRPLAHKGRHTYENLVPACEDCNNARGDSKLHIQHMIHPAWRRYVRWKVGGCKPCGRQQRGAISRW